MGRCAYTLTLAPSPTEAADAKLVNNNFESALKAKRLKGGEPISAAGPYYPQVWPRSRPLERLIVRLGRLSPDPF